MLESRLLVLIVTGVFTVSACCISFWLINKHKKHFSNGTVQSKIIGIIWMVPIYSIDSFLGLLIPSTAAYINMLRDCYEAYVLYLFLSLMLAYLGCEDDDFDIVAYLETKPSFKLPFPLNLICTRDVPRGRAFLRYCKFGTMQYCLIRPSTTLIAIILDLFGVYREDDLSGRYGYFYVLIILNISVAYAFIILATFYTTLKSKLKPFEPVGKFLCIKFVIFFAFWQSVIISLLVRFDVITSIGDYDTATVSTGLQNFLICIEMFITAVVHLYTFSYIPFTSGYVNPYYRTNAAYEDEEQQLYKTGEYALTTTRSSGRNGPVNAQPKRSVKSVHYSGSTAAAGRGRGSTGRLQFIRNDSNVNVGGVVAMTTATNEGRSISKESSSRSESTDSCSSNSSKRYARPFSRGPLEMLHKHTTSQSSNNSNDDSEQLLTSSNNNTISSTMPTTSRSTVPSSTSRGSSRQQQKYASLPMDDNDDIDAGGEYTTLVTIPTVKRTSFDPNDDDDFHETGTKSILLSNIRNRYAVDDNSEYMQSDQTECMKETSTLAVATKGNSLNSSSSAGITGDLLKQAVLTPISGSSSELRSASQQQLTQAEQVAQWSKKSMKERVSSIESRLSSGGGGMQNAGTNNRQNTSTGNSTNKNSILETHFAASTAIRDFNESMPVIVLPSNFEPQKGKVIHSDPAQRMRDARRKEGK